MAAQSDDNFHCWFKFGSRYQIHPDMVFVGSASFRYRSGFKGPHRGTYIPEGRYKYTYTPEGGLNGIGFTYFPALQAFCEKYTDQYAKRKGVYETMKLRRARAELDAHLGIPDLSKLVASFL